MSELFVPIQFKHLIGKISNDELRYRISVYNAIERYILINGKPTSMVNKLVMSWEDK